MFQRSPDAREGSVDPSIARVLYEKLKYVRRVEEVVAEIYPSDAIKSPVHLSIGQESVAVGVCAALRDDDVVSPTYRSHAAYLAKGGNLKAMMAEFYGKVDGCARGKGGSMHIVDMEHCVLGASAVVGTTVPIAMGYAFALKREGKGRVAVAFHGDGATEEGAFWESLNFAALHRLPILFVCENNGFAIHEPLHMRWATNDLAGKVRAFGVPAERIEDGCVFAIRNAALECVELMRHGSGPRFIECLTYRWREHVGPGEDFETGYRSRSDLDGWMESDQVARLARLLDRTVREEIDQGIEALVNEAVRFAELSPFPTIDELGTNVFAGE